MEILKVTTEELTKTGIKETAASIVAMVDEGNFDIMEVAIRLKANEELLAGLKKELGDLIHTEASKYEKGERKKLGVEWDIVNGRKSYDFTGDSEYMELKAKLKAREEYLKNKPQFDPETGEVSPVKINYAKDSIRYKFPK